MCADEKRAQLVSVTGIAGIGKSRLGWEFYKYFDGIEQIDLLASRSLPRLRRGRRLLGACRHGADAVRYRRGRRTAAWRSRSCARRSASTCSTTRTARFVEPRLAQLLGVGEHDAREQGDLFAAWRLFFERLAETYPTILAFEDMQWADAALLDFVEHLLEWSRDHPLFVVTLARPELAERRPTWGAGQRNFTALYLDPLPAAAMQELLAGLVPGLPPALARPHPRAGRGRAAVCGRDRADAARPRPPRRGRAVVSCRRRGRVARHPRDAAGARGRSSRRPRAEERRVVQDAAVLGKTFSSGALSVAERDRPAASSSRCSPASSARSFRPPTRSALARARPVRLPPGPDPPGRLRHALEARPPREAPRRGEPPHGRTWPRTRSRRSSPPTSSRPTGSTPTRSGAEELRERARRALSTAGERVAALGAVG